MNAFREGDIVRHRCSDVTSLVVGVDGECLLLADPDYPSWGNKAYLTVSPAYEFVRSLTREEFEERMERSIRDI